MREKEIKKAKPIVIEVNIQHYKSLMMSITISLLCMLQLNLHANSAFQRSHFVRNRYALRIVVCKLSQNFPVWHEKLNKFWIWAFGKLAKENPLDADRIASQEKCVSISIAKKTFLISWLWSQRLGLISKTKDSAWLWMAYEWDEKSINLFTNLLLPFQWNCQSNEEWSIWAWNGEEESTNYQPETDRKTA